MKGTQQKCFIASAITHGLLLVLLIVASAFLPQKKVEVEDFALNVVDWDFLVDEPNIAGGGNPRAGLPDPPPEPVRAAPPAPAPQAPALPAPQPAKPEAVPEPKQEKQPAISEPAPEVKPAEPKFNFAEATERKAPKTETTAPATPPPAAPAASAFDFNAAQRKTITPAPNSRKTGSSTDTGPSEREKQLANVFGGAQARMQKGLSTGVGEIGVPGPGGPAYASYNLALRKHYEDAWVPPQAGGDNEPLVEVEVTIARDGTVLSSRILKKAGKRDLDQSVQRTLDRVKKAPAFPSGSKDEKRTFKINFNLSSKLNLG